MWSFPAVETVVQDLRYGLRMMRRSPAVAMVAVLSLGPGLAIGVPAAIGGSRFVSSLLFEVSPSSPLALTTAAAIMLAVSLLAAWIPAHRASRVDPALALRGE